MKTVVLILMSLIFDHNAYQVNRYTFNEYEFDRHLLEEWFYAAHPDLINQGTKEWKECETLDVQSLNDLCFQVLSNLNMTKIALPVYDNFTYIPPSGKQPVQLERVIRRAPIKFRHFQNFTTHGTLIHCAYNETDIYLGEYNHTHVFRLDKDVLDNQFYLKTGLHTVTFKST